MCKYLKIYSAVSPNWSVSSCKARSYLYVPTIAELNSYCQGAGHENCPFFLCRKDRAEECLKAETSYNCAA